MLYRLLIFTVLCNYLFETANCDKSGNFFLKLSKSVPRIGKRGGKGNPEFEKFFLKASKSVPRIGRRNEVIYFLKIGTILYLFSIFVKCKFFKYIPIFFLQNPFETQYDVADGDHIQTRIKCKLIFFTLTYFRQERVD